MTLDQDFIVTPKLRLRERLEIKVMAFNWIRVFYEGEYRVESLKAVDDLEDGIALRRPLCGENERRGQLLYERVDE
jgi:hypothetical protein